MAFNPQPTQTPTAIGNIVVILKDAVAKGGEPAYQSAHFEVKIAFDNGSVITRRGNLIPHITPAQRQGLMDFMDNLRIQAESEILP